MRPTGRGSTHPGRPAAMPAGRYAPAPAAPALSASPALTVDFQGEDGRSRTFDLAALPLPGWHSALAQGWASRVGPAGGLRTLASAESSWGTLGRLMRFLATRPRPPAGPADLTAADLQAFTRDLRARRASNCWPEIRQAALILRTAPLGDLLASPVVDFLGQRSRAGPGRGQPGYSDGEYRRLVSAARADTARIRNRIQAGERLLACWDAHADAVTGADRQLAGQLAKVAAAGEVPAADGLDAARQMTARTALAGHLFVTRQDLLPLLLLLVAVTGLNAESVKELPAAHRILDGRAVELRMVKRRSGERRWHQTMTWEIGPPGRELHTPGGLYLLLHQLMARGRAISGPASLWSVWRNGNHQPIYGAAEHYNPFAGRLGNQIGQPRAWAARHKLTGDDPAGQPLTVTMRRLRTTVQIRRTRQLGGHLPSAARTNTVPVLFRNYLRGDPSVTDWAQEVAGEALAEAEAAMLAAHRHALAAGGPARVISEPSGGHSGPPGGAAAEAAWSTCADPASHPATGNPCQASFLDCFGCGNALISRDHLPRLLALLDALSARRQQLSQDEWWRRYGPAWAAIRHDVLAKFTPAEVGHARGLQPADALLDLAEAPWEQP